MWVHKKKKRNLLFRVGHPHVSKLIGLFHHLSPNCESAFAFAFKFVISFAGLRMSGHIWRFDFRMMIMIDHNYYVRFSCLSRGRYRHLRGQRSHVTNARIRRFFRNPEYLFLVTHACTFFWQTKIIKIQIPKNHLSAYLAKL